MKYVLSFVGVALVVIAICFCTNKPSANDDFLRIHITANSNSTHDQDLKYAVKDAVVNFLTPYLAEAENAKQAKDIISNKVELVQEVANSVLRQAGATYGATVKIKKENMPTRAYDNFVLEEGAYQSLSISLGKGAGDNWWCVVFPAVCFVKQS